MKKFFAILFLTFDLFSRITSNSYSATITENFTTSTYYDESNSSNAYLNLGLGQVTSKSVVEGDTTPIDLGTGADGDCAFSTAITGQTYNCKNLSITGTVTATGTAPLIIKTQGNVTISGTLNVSGQNGSMPVDATTEGTFGAAGPGGFPGGSCLAGDNSNGQDGSGDGKGIGGIFVGATGIGNGSGGGGGGGGSYSITNATAGADGVDDGFGSHGTGGAAGGAYGNQSLFLTTFVGGSGGGAGSAGNNFTGVHTYFTGGGSGGGGGAVKITAGGTFTIENTGSIISNGGNGGNGQTYGGGGGGGSGGAIFLQSVGELRNDGTITAVGGTAGTGGGGGANGGNGGVGGVGKIRIDAANGALTGSGGNPTPVAENPSGTNKITDTDYLTSVITYQSKGYDTGFTQVDYQSVTISKTLNGGTITLQFSDSPDNITFGNYVSEAEITTLSRRYIKFKATITPDSNVETTPILSSVVITYQEKATTTVTTVTTSPPTTYTSKINCGTLAIQNDPLRKDKLINSLMTFLLGLFPMFLFFIIRKFTYSHLNKRN